MISLSFIRLAINYVILSCEMFSVMRQLLTVDIVVILELKAYIHLDASAMCVDSLELYIIIYKINQSAVILHF